MEAGKVLDLEERYRTDMRRVQEILGDKRNRSLGGTVTNKTKHSLQSNMVLLKNDSMNSSSGVLNNGCYSYQSLVRNTLTLPHDRCATVSQTALSYTATRRKVPGFPDSDSFPAASMPESVAAVKRPTVVLPSGDVLHIKKLLLGRQAKSQQQTRLGSRTNSVPSKVEPVNQFQSPLIRVSVEVKTKRRKDVRDQKQKSAFSNSNQYYAHNYSTEVRKNGPHSFILSDIAAACHKSRGNAALPRVMVRSMTSAQIKPLTGRKGQGSHRTLRELKDKLVFSEFQKNLVGEMLDKLNGHMQRLKRLGGPTQSRSGKTTSS